MSELLNTLALATARRGLLLPEEKAMARKRSTQRGRIELKGDRWTLRYAVRDGERADGWSERREFLPVGITEREAERIRAERMQTINRLNNSLLVQPVMTLQHFVETLWVDYLKQRNVKPSTIYSYDSMLKNLVLPNFGQKTVDQITPVRLTQLFKAAREKKYSSKYLLNLYSLLKILFEVAREFDLIAASPIRPKLHRPVHERAEKGSYTPEQLRALSQHVPPEHKLLIFTAGVLGLRLGELLALRWIDLDGQIIEIRHSIWRGILQPPKTKASEARIALPSILVDLLTGHRESTEWRGQEDFIFCRSDGRPLDPDYLREQILYPVLQAAGIRRKARENGFHAFRHAAGSILYEITRDIEMVKRFLRHSRISTTSDIYVHPLGLTSEATEAMANVFLAVEEAKGVQ